MLPRYGWDTLFLTAFALGAASLALSLALTEGPRPELKPGEERGLRAALAQRELWPLWWMGTIFSTALTAFFIFVRRFVDDTGVGSVGMFFTAYTVAALLLRLGFGWLPDRVGEKRVLLPSLAALVLGFVVMAFAATDRDVIVAGVLCGIGHGFTFPILFALVVSRTPEANRGTVMALYTALFDLGVLVGGPVFGVAIEASGFAAMYFGAGVLVALGTVVFGVWDRRGAGVT